MKGLRRLAWITLGFALVSLVAMVASQLALTDIGHGERDVTQEWRVVQIGFLAILAFHVSAVLTLARLLRMNGGSRG